MKRPVGRPEGSCNQLPVGVRLGVIPLGRSGGRFRIVLSSRAARADSCVRSKPKTLSEAALARLESFVKSVKPKRGEPLDPESLDAMLKDASAASGHANASAEGRERMHKARQLGGGHWHGKLDLDELMDSPGFVVVRKLVDAADCKALRDSAEARFGAHPLRSKRKEAHSPRALGRLAGDKVHADQHRGRATLRSLARSAMDDLDAAADAAWHNAVLKVAGCAGHDAEQSADEAFNLCAHKMARQTWHTDSTASLAYIVALTDAPATEFLQLHERWIDVSACSAARRKAFFGNASAAAATASSDVVRSADPELQPGDVIFFYTQRVHRAPPPPAPGKPRYTLFGAFCREGKSNSMPQFFP